jgi:hypothetical protein
MVGSRVRISASSCNIGIRDANCWFDSSALVRQFKLDLANPFERAVALLVLYLIASHQTYIIGVSEYLDPDAKSTIQLGECTVLRVSSSAVAAVLCVIAIQCRGRKWLAVVFTSAFHGSAHEFPCREIAVLTLPPSLFVTAGLTEKVVVDYENKRLVKEQHDQIESLKIVQAAASDTESALGECAECCALACISACALRGNVSGFQRNFFLQASTSMACAAFLLLSNIFSPVALRVSTYLQVTFPCFLVMKTQTNSTLPGD